MNGPRSLSPDGDAPVTWMAVGVLMQWLAVDDADGLVILRGAAARARMTVPTTAGVILGLATRRGPVAAHHD